MQLLMRRPDLEALPDLLTLPDGYTLRTASEDDIPALASLLCAAFLNPEWTEAEARKALFDDTTVKTVFVIEHDDALVATASSRLLPEAFPASGYVHWVGADPVRRGLKLGYIVTLATLYDFVRLGCRDAVLETDDERLPAIATYFKLGFMPVYRDDTHIERWEKIHANLRR